MFKLKRSIDGQFYYVFIAENGEPLVTSETVHNKRDAKKSLNALVWGIKKMGDNFQVENVIDETEK